MPSIKEPIKLFYLVAYILQPDVDLDLLLEITSLDYMSQERYYDLILTFMCYIYDNLNHALPFPLSDLQSLYGIIRMNLELPLYPRLEQDLEEAYYHLDYEKLKEIEKKLSSLEGEDLEI